MNRMVVQKMHIDGETFSKAPAGSELNAGVKELLGQVCRVLGMETHVLTRRQCFVIKSVFISGAKSVQSER